MAASHLSTSKLRGAPSLRPNMVILVWLAVLQPDLGRYVDAVAFAELQLNYRRFFVRRKRLKNSKRMARWNQRVRMRRLTLAFVTPLYRLARPVCHRTASPPRYDLRRAAPQIRSSDPA